MTDPKRAPRRRRRLPALQTEITSPPATDVLVGPALEAWAAEWVRAILGAEGITTTTTTTSDEAA